MVDFNFFPKIGVIFRWKFEKKLKYLKMIDIYVVRLGFWLWFRIWYLCCIITDFWWRKLRFTGRIPTLIWKRWIFPGSKKYLKKKRYVLLFTFKWWFEWRMTIGEKFQNQGGDRFTREVAHFVECLLLPRLCNKGILFFVTQRYKIRLSFWWRIRIYQIQKITVNGRW